tara:strand:+ start:3300 stop:4916 length:1617 start_codon:yes stop_codon:yes gene_type:complete
MSLMDAITREVAKIQKASGGESSTRGLDTFAEAYSMGIEAKERERKDKYYKDLELDGISDSLDSLISIVDNTGSLETAEAQLGVYEDKAGSNAEHKIKAMALREAINTKKQDYSNFGNAISEASSAIDSGEMSFKQADYENLPETFKSINAKRKAEGLKEHGSIMDYMSSEFSRTQRLIEGISPGITRNEDGSVKAKFRYGKANNSDIATYNQLVKHAGNIEIAMKALAGDGMITPEEAQAMVVNPENYENVKKSATSEAKSQYNNSKQNYNAFMKFINQVDQGLFEFDEDAMGFDTMSPEDKHVAKTGSAEKIKEVLNKEKNRYYNEMLAQDQKHFQWSGRRLNLSSEDDILSGINIGDYDDSNQGLTTQQIVNKAKGKQKVQPQQVVQTPSPYNKSSKVISKSSKPSVVKKGQQVISNLESIDKNIKEQEDIISKAKTDRKALEDRQTQIEKELKDIASGFGKMTSTKLAPKEIDDARSKLLLELKDVKAKQKSVGSEAYRRSFKKKIKDAEKKRTKLEKDKAKLKSQLKSLEKIK